VAVFENRQPLTAAKFITKSSLFIQLRGVIRRLELKPNNEQKLSIYSSPRHIAKLPVIGGQNTASVFLLPNIVHFNPITVGVLKIDLLHTVCPYAECILIPVTVSKRDFPSF
jgi:hypothetical protein